MKSIKILILLVCIVISSDLQAQYFNHYNKDIFEESNETSFLDFINGTKGILTIDGSFNVLKDFTNNGKVLYTYDAGSVSFLGFDNQEISGSGSTMFNEFLINNSKLNLNQDIEVSHMTFVSGIIYADQNYSGLIDVIDNGDCTGMSDFSFVDGKVEKTGDDEFLFPIGDQFFYRYASISAPDNTSDVFTAQYFFESPSSESYDTRLHDASVSLINDSEYWVIDRDKGTSTPRVTLSWDVYKTTPANFVPQEIDKMRIVRWDGTKWITEESVSYTGDLSSGTITASVSDYGVFTLAVGNSLDSDNVFIPNGFSPNNDGINDFFEIKGLNKYPDAKLEIYNRWGSLVYEKDSYGNVSRLGKLAWWNGYALNGIGNDPLPAATYIYLLKLGGDNSQILKGTIFINR